MFSLTGYIILCIIMSAYQTHGGTTRILNYRQGQAITVRGFSESGVRKRANYMIESMKKYDNAPNEKIAGLVVGGFIGSLITWPLVLLNKFAPHTVQIRNGRIL